MYTVVFLNIEAEVGDWCKCTPDKSERAEVISAPGMCWNLYSSCSRPFDGRMKAVLAIKSGYPLNSVKNTIRQYFKSEGKYIDFHLVCTTGMTKNVSAVELKWLEKQNTDKCLIYQKPDTGDA